MPPLTVPGTFATATSRRKAGSTPLALQLSPDRRRGRSFTQLRFALQARSDRPTRSTLGYAGRFVLGGLRAGPRTAAKRRLALSKAAQSGSVTPACLARARSALALSPLASRQKPSQLPWVKV